MTGRNSHRRILRVGTALACGLFVALSAATGMLADVSGDMPKRWVLPWLVESVAVPPLGRIGATALFLMITAVIAVEAWRWDENE